MKVSSRLACSRSTGNVTSGLIRAPGALVHPPSGAIPCQRVLVCRGAPRGRRLLLTLTAKGKRAYAALASAARRRHDNLLSVLTGEERQVLERVLTKLQARASEMLGVSDLGFGKKRTFR